MATFLRRITVTICLLAGGLAGFASPAAAIPVADAQDLQEVLAAEDYDPEVHGALLRLYLAFFDREPDIAGAKYWIGVSNSASLTEISILFTASPEYRNLYSGTSDQDFLAAVYANVLGRQFDEGGFDYWLDTMKGTNLSGKNEDLAMISRGEVVRWVSASPEFVAENPFTAADTPIPVEPSAPTHELVPPSTPDPDRDSSLPAPGFSSVGETPCPLWDGGSPRVTSFENAPPLCIDPAAVYEATLSTTAGPITIELDASAAPNTVNNFIVLSLYHFYDGVAFHRSIPDFVIQGGDATGPQPGFGDAGYVIADELPTIDTVKGRYYDVGSVAMANAGVDDSGSQFFIVTGRDGEDLPGIYSKFGTVTSGLDAVRAIEAGGSPSGTPTQLFTINAVGITIR